MEERERTSKIFLIKQGFPDAVGCRTGKLTIGIIIENALEIAPGSARAVKGAITFGEIKVSAGPAWNAGKLAEVFFVFGRRQVIELAGKKAICVIELTFVGCFFFGGGRFDRWLLRFGRWNP